MRDSTATLIASMCRAVPVSKRRIMPPHDMQMAVSVTQCGPPSLTGISLSNDDDGRGYDPVLDDELWDECG